MSVAFHKKRRIGASEGGLRTGGGGDGRVEEGDGRVDEERVTGEGQADGPVGSLEEEEAGDDGRELGPPVEGHLEGHRHAPQQQRRREEYRRVALRSPPGRCHLPLRPPLSLSGSLSPSVYEALISSEGPPCALQRLNRCLLGDIVTVGSFIILHRYYSMDPNLT